MDGVALCENDVGEVESCQTVVGVDDNRAVLHVVNDCGIFRPAEGFRGVEEISVFVAVILHTEIRGVIRTGFLCPDGNGICSRNNTRNGLHKRRGISKHEAGIRCGIALYVRGVICGHYTGSLPIIGHAVKPRGVFYIVDASGKLLLHGNGQALHRLLQLGYLLLHFQHLLLFAENGVSQRLHGFGHAGHIAVQTIHGGLKFTQPFRVIGDGRIQPFNISCDRLDGI